MEPLVPAPAEPKAWQGDRKAEWIMMGKQKIPLEAWETIQGSAALDESGLRIQPDPDGFVRLQLKGETARMGGVSWTCLLYTSRPSEGSYASSRHRRLH